MCWDATKARSWREEATQEGKFSSPVFFFIFGVSFGDWSLKSSVCTEIKLRSSLYLSGAALVSMCCRPTVKDPSVNMGIITKKGSKLFISSALFHFGAYLLLCHWLMTARDAEVG